MRFVGFQFDFDHITEHTIEATIQIFDDRSLFFDF